MSHKKLEQYKWFSTVAWTLAIGFALFVVSLSLELRTTATELSESSISLKQRMNYLEQNSHDRPTSTNDEIN